MVERLAKLINWVYIKCNCDFGIKGSDVNIHECDSLWNEETFFNQQSSRASARGLIRRWREMGFVISCDTCKKHTLCFPDISKIKDKLAEEEHLRWMSFHFARGINTWRLQTVAEEGGIDVVEDPKIAEKIEGVKANQIASFNVHAALVPFKELPLVDQALDVLKLKKDNEKEFQVVSCDSYAGEGKKSSVREKGCLQANDYSINALLENEDALSKVGLILNKIKEAKDGL